MMNDMAESERIGTLFMVATPIGNLGDITLRALETLKRVHAVFAEDTRVTAKLLQHYGIRVPVFRYDEHSHGRAAGEVIRMLLESQDIALLSDAGTPGIADPGARLVGAVLAELPQAVIVPLPGPTAIGAVLSASGVPAEQFAFLGYPPHKKGRKTFFANLKSLTLWPAVIYESPHRIAKALASIEEALGGERRLVIGRELTKLHEELFRGTVAEALLRFKEGAKGEFVIVIFP